MGCEIGLRTAYSKFLVINYLLHEGLMSVPIIWPSQLAKALIVGPFLAHMSSHLAGSGCSVAG